MTIWTLALAEAQIGGRRRAGHSHDQRNQKNHKEHKEEYLSDTGRWKDWRIF
jgi:hypothetical protein